MLCTYSGLVLATQWTAGIESSKKSTLSFGCFTLQQMTFPYFFEAFLAKVHTQIDNFNETQCFYIHAQISCEPYTFYIPQEYSLLHISTISSEVKF